MWGGTSASAFAYQVDNTQDWNYYGERSHLLRPLIVAAPTIRPIASSPEYDIWTLPQAADNYQQTGDPEPCDPLTEFLHM